VFTQVAFFRHAILSLMNTATLEATAKRLVAAPKGILAIDESMSTCNKRFEKLGVPTTVEKRRDYRDLLVSAPGIEEYVSGFILFDETIRQATVAGVPFAKVLLEKGIDPGIKVDLGTQDLALHPGEKITEGLDGLRTRFAEYMAMGATFAKWRSVISITDTLPTEACLHTNAAVMAYYAALAQEADIVPIVEPEVLIDGTHSIDRCAEVVARTLDVLFAELKTAGVHIPGVILKTSMVLSGKEATNRATQQEVAEKTVAILKAHVPSDIGGIVFLSGGQSDDDATMHLNLMHQQELPWPLTFSYGRGIQNPALVAWAKNPDDVRGAQSLLVERAKANSLASIGKY
jgi:fructose-bisphosphate aldolase class I